jgi:hypothetical protein
MIYDDLLDVSSIVKFNVYNNICCLCSDVFAVY